MADDVNPPVWAALRKRAEPTHKPWRLIAPNAGHWEPPGDWIQSEGPWIVTYHKPPLRLEDGEPDLTDCMATWREA